MMGRFSLSLYVGSITDNFMSLDYECRTGVNVSFASNIMTQCYVIITVILSWSNDTRLFLPPATVPRISSTTVITQENRSFAN